MRVFFSFFLAGVQEKHLQRNDTVTELALCKIRRATQAAEPTQQLEALKEGAPAACVRACGMHARQVGKWAVC